MSGDFDPLESVQKGTPCINVGISVGIKKFRQISMDFYEVRSVLEPLYWSQRLRQNNVPLAEE